LPETYIRVPEHAQINRAALPPLVL